MKKIRLSKRQKIATLLVTVVMAMVAIFVLFREKSPINTITDNPDQKYYSRLTGIEVSEDVSRDPILAVMIENSEEARPQTGLDAAGIVFETVTEAGITRYLALYQENMPEEVGPVRSVRPAFVDWLMGFDAPVAHVGGSEQALGMLDDRKAKSLNQFYNDQPYYRRADREAPHNMYARMKDLVSLMKDKDLGESKFDPISFEDESPVVPATPNTITIRFSSPLFTAAFNYDAATNSYLRNLAGAPHVDAATNKQISVKNVLVLKADIQNGALGKGSGQLFKNGTAQNITWNQQEFSKRIVFTDENGQEVAFNRGDTWIAVIPSSGAVTTQ